MSSFSKRKNLTDPEDASARPTKQPRLDAFFASRFQTGLTGGRGSAAQNETTRGSKNTLSAANRPPPAGASVSGPNLSAEQKAVLDMVLNDRRSVFFTGSAGLFCVTTALSRSFY